MPNGHLLPQNIGLARPDPADPYTDATCITHVPNFLIENRVQVSIHVHNTQLRMLAHSVVSLPGPHFFTSDTKEKRKVGAWI